VLRLEELKLNRYLIASIFFHLMLLGLLSITHTFQQNDTHIFSVRLLTPSEIRTHVHGLPDKMEAQTSMPATHRQEEAPLPPDTLSGSARSAGQEDEEEDTPMRSETGRQDVQGGGQEGKERSTPIEGDRAITEEEDAPSGGLRVDPYAFLFDRETIERLARRPSDNNKGGLTFYAPEFRHRGYMRMLKQRIESIWRYPRSAIRQGLSGDLYIRFSIKRDGSLGGIELIRTSGHRSLDEAAMKAIRDAQPFWPLPEDWQGDTLVINGHFIYILGHTFIM